MMKDFKNNLLHVFVLLSLFFLVSSCNEEEIDTGDDVTCDNPTDLTISELSTVPSLTFNWVAGAAETSWEVEYGETGYSQGTGTSLVITDNVAEVSGIDPTKAYDFYVKALCSDALSSAWVGPVTSEALTVAPNHAMMTATIDGVYYGVLKPVFYPSFSDAIDIYTVFGNKYIWIQGNSNHMNPGAGGNREINLYLFEEEWSEGTYNLINDGGSEESYFNIIIQDENMMTPEIDGTITVTNFDTTTRVIEGTFELNYELYNTATGITTGPFVATGDFDYSLDDPYFD